MFRRFVCMLSAAGILIMASFPAVAAEGEGRITVYPENGTGLVSGGQVTLHRIGSFTPEGIALTDGLADWMIREEELTDRELLRWVLDSPRKEGRMQPVAQETGAVFDALDAGIYLISQNTAARGYEKFPSFLVRISEQDGWSATVTPPVIRSGESPRTADRPAPIWGAMGIGFSVTMLMILMDKGKK